MNISELMYDLEECKLEVESVLWEIVCRIWMIGCYW